VGVLFLEVGCLLFFLQLPNENENDNFYWSFTSSDAFGVAFVLSQILTI
jgi:hypothetical protein